MNSRMRKPAVTLVTCLAGTMLLLACGKPEQPAVIPIDLDVAAARYLDLGLALSSHDPHFVASYYGSSEIREQALAHPRSLEQIEEVARSTAAAITAAAPGEEAAVQGRRAFLVAQLGSVAVRAALLQGQRSPFMQEAEMVFGASVPDLNAREYVLALHARIDRIMPGTGLLVDRIERFRRQFIIPRERLAAVVEAAVAECRRRTHAAMALPEERLEIEYSSGVNWLTFNEYRGNGFSVIKINTDLPIYIDRALEMGCHEGYPGHHVSNVIKERELVKNRGWQEFTLQTLFSPQTLVEEGAASFGVNLAFPPADRVAFERDVLFDLAGFDRAQAQRYFDLKLLLDELAYADIEAARRYLDGEWDAGFTARWLINYRLLSPERARQRLAVFDTYRTFIAAGYIGRKDVKAYVLGKAGEDNAEEAWRVFRELLAAPMLPENLRN